MAKLIVIFTLLIAGCEEREPRPEAAARGSSSEKREIDELRALGYLSYTETEPKRTGLIRRDPKRSQPGYTFYATRVRCHATLVDAEGAVVHTWQAPACRGWDHVELLDNGHLLAAARGRPRSPIVGRRASHDRSLLQLSRDSKIVWRRDLWAHHDAVETPNGQIATIVSDLRRIPRVHRRVPVRDDRIAVLDGDSFSLFDVLANNDLGFTMQEVAVSNERGRDLVDLLHTNSLEWLPGNRVLVSMRHQDSVALIDVPTRKLRWIWGPNELSGPHDATRLASDNILVFDNGMKRKRSRVVEIDPRTNSIVWQYGWGKDELEFFTLSHGSAQRLANGNTLLAVSDSARILEVTTSGDIVWELIAPAPSGTKRHATIARARRYDTERIDAWLRR